MKSLKRISGFVLCSLFVLGTLVNTSAMAATPEQIEASIQAGIEWLVSQQDPDTGQWQDVPRTGFVLIKLQDRAYELGKDPFETDPLDPNYYEYATNVIDGWEYLFAVDGAGNPIRVLKQNIADQNHTAGASGTIDDPDTRANGYGIHFGHSVYNTGICLMALTSSGKPNRVNDGGIDYDGDGNVDTFAEIAQDAVDWLAFAQADCGAYEGGYVYGALDNSCWSADNSNAGYAYLGLAAAEGFGCTVPAWVRTELNPWITAIQDPVNGDVNDGGSWYIPGDPRGSWANELKTGNLIFEMTFYGDDPSVLRFKDAMDYIERHWQGQNVTLGWKGDKGIDDDGDGLIDEDPFDLIDNDVDGLTDEDRGRNAYYQGMYCLMKGFEYSLINLIDLDGDNTPEHDWYQEFATVLLAQQNVNGSWPSIPNYVWPDGSPGSMSGTLLSTIWALLTLERIAPPPTNEPPDCNDAYADIACLWPPNHKFVPVKILGVTDPDGDPEGPPPSIIITAITSDEATATELGAGGAEHAPDADGVRTDTALLRAERSGINNGRVYVISFTAIDAEGAECEGSVEVKVPHDQRPSRRSPAPCEAIDDGQNYDATQIN